MKRLVRIAAVLMLMALIGAPMVGGAALANKAAAPLGTTITINQQGKQFVPKTITINVGDTVMFVNKDTVEHTAQASDGSWASDDMQPGATFSHTFNAAGTVNFFCKYHGSAQGTGMAGTITVIAAAGGGTGNTSQPTMPQTGSEGSTANLWLFAMLAVLLVGSGLLLLRRRAA